MKPVAETQMATSPWAPSAIIGRKHYKAYVDVLARSQPPVISMTSSSTCSPKHGVQKSPVHRWHTIRQSPCTMPAHPSQDVAGSKSSGSRSSPQLGHLLGSKQPLPHSWLEAVRLHLEAIAIPGVGAATPMQSLGQTMHTAMRRCLQCRHITTLNTLNITIPVYSQCSHTNNTPPRCRQHNTFSTSVSELWRPFVIPVEVRTVCHQPNTARHNMIP